MTYGPTLKAVITGPLITVVKVMLAIVGPQASAGYLVKMSTEKGSWKNGPRKKRPR